MPMQTQQVDFMQKYGARAAAANEALKDAPVDTGFMRLPPGIKNGIAKLQVMTVKRQEEDGKKVPKGEPFFRAAAVVIYPLTHGGFRCEGLQTSQVVSLCDVPATEFRKAETFEDGYAEMQNLIRLCGIPACPETKASDPAGQKQQAYWYAAMRTLTDPARPPVYVSFSTREWAPPPKPGQPKREPMVFETWHGLADLAALNGAVQHDPAAGITVRPGAAPMQPDRAEAPPTMGPDGLPILTNSRIHAPEVEDVADRVAGLVVAALEDPEGASEEGQAAHASLEELAWANGWTREDTVGAADWEEVGGMALTAKGKPSAGAIATVPAVGAKCRFRKRDRNGAPLVKADGSAFPALDVEVATVDAATRTCTVRVVKDGKVVSDIKSKNPVAVKFEWLELTHRPV